MTQLFYACAIDEVGQYFLPLLFIYYFNSNNILSPKAIVVFEIKLPSDLPHLQLVFFLISRRIAFVIPSQPRRIDLALGIVSLFVRPRREILPGQLHVTSHTLFALFFYWRFFSLDRNHVHMDLWYDLKPLLGCSRVHLILLLKFVYIRVNKIQMIVDYIRT